MSLHCGKRRKCVLKKIIKWLKEEYTRERAPRDAKEARVTLRGGTATQEALVHQKKHSEVSLSADQRAASVRFAQTRTEGGFPENIFNADAKWKRSKC